jgi:hypothetical protein
MKAIEVGGRVDVAPNAVAAGNAAAVATTADVAVSASTGVVVDAPGVMLPEIEAVQAHPRMIRRIAANRLFSRTAVGCAMKVSWAPSAHDLGRVGAVLEQQRACGLGLVAGPHQQMDPVRIAEQLVGIASVHSLPTCGLRGHPGLPGIAEQARNLVEFA